MFDILRHEFFSRLASDTRIIIRMDIGRMQDRMVHRHRPTSLVLRAIATYALPGSTPFPDQRHNTLVRKIPNMELMHPWCQEVCFRDSNFIQTQERNTLVRKIPSM